MRVTNEQFMAERDKLRKADLAISDLSSGGGYLVTAQAKAWIERMIDESVLLQRVNKKEMYSHTQEYDLFSFPTRIAFPGAEATAATSGQRVKPTTAKVTLSAVLIKAQVNLNDLVLEDNIEKEAFQAKIVRALPGVLGRDVEELLINGDTTLNGTDTYLDLWDGLLKASTSNSVSHGTVAIDKSLFPAMMKALPSRYHRNEKNYEFWTSHTAVIDYADSISNRATGYGDATLQQNGQLMWRGKPIVGVPLFPTNQGAGTNETSMIMTDPMNCILGVYTGVQVKTDEDIETGVVKIVARMRLAFKYLEETSVVKGTAIKVA
jgi:HK97 family phage major capsid protein